MDHQRIVPPVCSSASLFADGILVGIGTVIADDPLLTVRLKGKKNCRQPVRIVLDSELKIPLNAQLVQTASLGPVLIFCGLDASAGKERSLSNAGMEVIRVRPGNFGLDVADVLKELGRKRITSLLVEGGGHVLGSFTQEGLADEFYFFYAPKILSDPGGVSMLNGRPKFKIADCIRAYGMDIRMLGEDLLVRGRFREQPY